MAEETDIHVQALSTAQKQMYDSRFEAALETIRPVLDASPDHADALYMQAVCARYLKRYDEAREALDRIKRTAPDFGRAFQEEGHLLRAIGDNHRALTAYQRACRFNPALVASWQAQADLLQTAGRPAEAGNATAQAERITALPRELVSVTHLLHEGKLLKAEKLCRAFLQKTPHHVEAMRLLAELGNRFGVLEDADFLLESAIGFEPGNTQLRLDHIQVLRKRQKFTAALEQAKHLYDSDPDNPVFKSHYAIECMQTGSYDAALRLFDEILDTLPNDPATLTSRGHALKTLGRQDEAIASYRQAFASKPDHGDAWYGLANLKTYRFTDDEIAAMQALEAGPDLAFQDRVHISFALAKAFEDRDEIAQSFGFYEKGNTLKRIQARYTTEQMEEELRAQAEICTEDLFAAQAGKGCPDADPIFIVGLPRAGSTLLEQILASHSQVDGTLELPNILALSHRLRGRQRLSDKTRYPRILHELTADQLTELGQDYIDNTRIHRAGAPRFTDKMPNNFRHIGLIKLILPNARIIDARRHPMACCFSGFKQLFAEGQEFTYGLEEIGHYYRNYVALMDHWDRVLPGQILRVNYEDVVADLDSQVRRLLDFCGLPFEQACLDFHATERAVRTASSEQVRQPIFDSGVAQWKKFEPHLAPLKQALGEELLAEAGQGTS
ncbi:tetratricopeptide repeat protein [Maricaulis maris]|uniref:Tetratricopeptide repeat protein n=1 Tax=Maricaulis maris TaxID=74318 RepID=A0A495D2Y6_9PROT|nr:tetratricopeptide repeat-containing sulfotransferase family protein [Maricaulis maris]RKQ96094.1 tetratricopeptide repeat protein [Maricaulis maris]